MGTTNPYEPPAAPIAIPNAGDGPAAWRSRWLPLRRFPMALLGTFTAICWLGSANIVATGWSLWSAATPRAVLIREAWLIAGGVLVGALSFLAARSWYVCRWKRAVVLTILYAAVIAALASAGQIF